LSDEKTIRSSKVQGSPTAARGGRMSCFWGEMPGISGKFPGFFFENFHPAFLKNPNSFAGFVGRNFPGDMKKKFPHFLSGIFSEKKFSISHNI
jgi:hypothetical protein